MRTFWEKRKALNILGLKKSACNCVGFRWLGAAKGFKRILKKM